jgi:hypothetical protein
MYPIILIFLHPATPAGEDVAGNCLIEPAPFRHPAEPVKDANQADRLSQLNNIILKKADYADCPGKPDGWSRFAPPSGRAGAWPACRASASSASRWAIMPSQSTSGFHPFRISFRQGREWAGGLELEGRQMKFVSQFIGEFDA